MAILKMRNQEPPGGWRYLQPDTRAMIRGDSMYNLVQLVIAHRRYKNLEPTDEAAVQLDVERQLCTRLTKRDCTPEGPNDDWVPMKEEEKLVDFQAIVNFSRAAIEWIGSGKELVPTEEARRRAEICFTCPLNQRAEGCLPCSVLHGMIRAAIPENRRIDGLEVCKACGCDLKSKVNAPMAFLKSVDEGRSLEYPAWCWMNGP